MPVTWIGTGRFAAAGGGTPGGAIAFVNAGAFNGGGPAANPLSVAHHATTVTSGNKLLLEVVTRSSNDGLVTTPSGWNLVATAVGGAGAWGSATGNARISVYERTSDGTEAGTSVSVTWDAGASNGCIGGRIFQFSKTNPNWVSPAQVNGADSTEGTDWSATGGTIEMLTNDMIVSLSGMHEDAVMGSEAISASGITFGTPTERADDAIGFANLGHLYAATVAVTTGSATPAAPTWTMTSAIGTPAGITMFVRLRDAA